MNMLCFAPFPILETERLVLRQLAASDFRLIFNYQSNKANFEYVDMPVYKTLEEAKNYIRKMNKGIAENKWIIWAIAHKETDQIIGTVSLWNFNNSNTVAELGYGLYPANRGKGYMSEALKTVTEFGFNDIGLKTVQAYTNRQNSKSIDLLERNKFVRQEDFIDTHTYSGIPMEMVIYAMNASHVGGQ